MMPNVELFKGKEHIFDHVGVSEDVNSIFNPRVRMKGGYLISSKQKLCMWWMWIQDPMRKQKQEDNSLKTNLEAAREIAKQLKLRDIGGIIVVDFIDLKDEKIEKNIWWVKERIRKDPAKTNIVGMSDFGLIQITRQRIRPSVRILYRTFAQCAVDQAM